MVIVEFCAFGDLQSYLRHCRGVEDKYYQDLYKAPIEKLGSRDLLSFAIQTARGMAHLAGMKVNAVFWYINLNETLYKDLLYKPQCFIRFSTTEKSRIGACKNLR